MPTLLLGELEELFADRTRLHSSLEEYKAKCDELQKQLDAITDFPAKVVQSKHLFTPHIEKNIAFPDAYYFRLEPLVYKLVVDDYNVTPFDAWPAEAKAKCIRHAAEAIAERFVRSLLHAGKATT